MVALLAERHYIFSEEEDPGSVSTKTCPSASILLKFSWIFQRKKKGKEPAILPIYPLRAESALERRAWAKLLRKIVPIFFASCDKKLGRKITSSSVVAVSLHRNPIGRRMYPSWGHMKTWSTTVLKSYSENSIKLQYRIVYIVW